MRLWLLLETIGDFIKVVSVEAVKERMKFSGGSGVNGLPGSADFSLNIWSVDLRFVAV